jgi:1-acyl-sn-glycerol-3-phosphate acyltransferase
MLRQSQLEAIVRQMRWSLQPQLAGAWERTLYWLGRSVIDLYTFSMLAMDIQWLAPLPEGAKILAANHPTTTDPFFILALIPEQMSVMVTRSAFEVPVFGSYLQQAGHVPVVRGSGGTSVHAAVRLLKAGRTVAIFPEGALSPLEGGIGFHQPHTGVARLALSSGAPVVPVGIGLDRAGIRHRLVEVGGKPEEARFYLCGPYALTVGEPMWFKGRVEDRDYVRSVSERIMQRIVQLSQASLVRVKTPRPAMLTLQTRPRRLRYQGAVTTRFSALS